MRIQIIGLVLLAILATSDADPAMAQERIDTSSFSAAAKAELSDGAQAVDILNRIYALYDPALDGKVGRLQVSLYDLFGDQLWPAPKRAEVEEAADERLEMGDAPCRRSARPPSISI